MTNEIKDAIGGISAESELLINKFSANFETIDKKITTLKQRVRDLEIIFNIGDEEVKDSELKNIRDQN
jgi:hypothetical protein